MAYFNRDVIITKHAIDQYRKRVLACPERNRSNQTLRKPVYYQVQLGEWHLAGGGCIEIRCGTLMPKAKKWWEWKVVTVTHTFVVWDGAVVTTLGYRMRTSRKANRQRRRMQMPGQMRTP